MPPTASPIATFSREVIVAEAAPAAVGPYSHAVIAGGLLFCSGQLPLDPATGALVEEGPAGQAAQCLHNLSAICVAAGTTLSRAVRVGVYLTDLSAFEEVNAAYAAVFAEDAPARTALQVAALPRGAQVEIEAIVAL